jgi:hypothetical protein
VKKFFKIHLAVYPSTIYVAIGYDSIYKVQKRIGVTKKELDGFEKLSDSPYAVTYNFNNGNCCLLFFETLNNVSDLWMMVHETIHALHYILQYYGLKLSDETDETYAYCAQYIFNEFISKFKDQKLCLKKSK